MTVYRVPERLAAVLFDVDGTLYSHEGYARSQGELLVRELARVRGSSYGDAAAEVERARADYAAAHGGAATSLGNAMAALGVDLATSVAWRERLLEPRRYLAADGRLRSALSALRARGLVLEAVTNNPRSVGEATLDALGVADLFSRVVGLDDTMRSKPAREPYELAAALAGAAFADCLSVGDRYDVDLAVPLAMGMGGVLVDGVSDVYALPELLYGVSSAP